MKFLHSIKKFLKKNEQIIVYAASALSLICAFVIIGYLISFAIDSNSSSATIPKEPSTSISASIDSTTAEVPSDSTEDSTTENNNKEEATTKENETTKPGEESTEKDPLPYLIKVNTALNCVTIYTKDSSGKYTVPTKAMICSTGKSGTPTPQGSFKLSDIYSWTKITDNSHAQSAIKFNGSYMFQTVPYTSMKNGTLDTEVYNSLGESTSSGNVILTVADMTWIRQNCPTGTPVEIYSDSSSAGPLGKPTAIKIPLKSSNKGWDPTDLVSDNPWNQKKPVIRKNSDDIVIGYGATKAQLLENFSILDTCRNDIANLAKITGSYDLNTPGDYTITITVTDALLRYTSLSVNITVLSTPYGETPTTGATEDTSSNETETSSTIVDETTTSAEPDTSEDETTTKSEPPTESDVEKDTTTESETTTKEETTTVAETTTVEETTTEPIVEEETTTESSELE